MPLTSLSHDARARLLDVRRRTCMKEGWSRHGPVLVLASPPKNALLAFSMVSARVFFFFFFEIIMATEAWISSDFRGLRIVFGLVD